MQRVLEIKVLFQSEVGEQKDTVESEDVKG